MNSGRQLRTSVFIATSVDGFIARENGDIDWLGVSDEGKADAGEDFGYGAFFETVDSLVMGRRTYEKVLTFGGWPYGTKPVVVMSSRRLEIADQLRGTVEATSRTPAEIVEDLEARGMRHAYIDGGRTIQSFLAADLLDRLIVSRIPILIGSGKPLFGPVPHDIRLRHVRTRDFPGGLVQSEYDVLRPA